MLFSEEKYDVLIVGTGVAGLCCALNLPESAKVLMLSKDAADRSDSFLAQGGICVLKSPDDFAQYFDDTMRAGHYENNPDAVKLMIESSPDMIAELVRRGVSFARDEAGNFRYTREGGHSSPRILFHDDVTGKEITSNLLREAKERKNIRIAEYCELVDVIAEGGECFGGVVRIGASGELVRVYADYTLLASGGIGGLYENSTNYRHLTGDALAIAMKNGAEVEHLDYVQIHPTTFYSEKHGRRFLISESVRGEGGVLLDAEGRRFCNELLPRDIVSGEIREQMKKDGTKFVWLDMRPIGEKTIREHFPTIFRHCLDEGFDVLKTPIPVVPAQHYFMGGIKVDLDGRTNIRRLYAAGETACNGVHGKNRLASNSLLESLIWAKRAANSMMQRGMGQITRFPKKDTAEYADYRTLKENYANMIREEAEREAYCD
ncbi:MAG TPA: L-aspartate oxidase [Candidatus Borkfalkia excrementavium]|uniref:L-aspartate oxidase n=1 Tax=Candidatus Borkfalkia excrementavium TaxID=2838505 RepID=A0A9D1Z6P6_9FIRM|nr:L-aspartate oxidase [Candidatus Borkfalkia excrementavium]